MEIVPVGTNYYCPALLHSIFSMAYAIKKIFHTYFQVLWKELLMCLYLPHMHQEKKKKNQSKSAMFTLGDGRDGCSLLQGAFSIRFRDKADWWMSSSSYLSLAEGMGYLNAVNN